MIPNCFNILILYNYMFILKNINCYAHQLLVYYDAIYELYL